MRLRERYDTLYAVRELVHQGNWVVLDSETTSLEGDIIQWAVAAPDGTILGQTLAHSCLDTGSESSVSDHRTVDFRTAFASPYKGTNLDSPGNLPLKRSESEEVGRGKRVRKDVRYAFNPTGPPLERIRRKQLTRLPSQGRAFPRKEQERRSFFASFVLCNHYVQFASTNMRGV